MSKTFASMENGTLVSEDITMKRKKTAANTSPRAQSNSECAAFPLYKPGQPVFVMTVEEYVKKIYPDSPLTSEHYAELHRMVLLRSMRDGGPVLVRPDLLGRHMPDIVFEVEQLLNDKLISSYVFSESAKVELVGASV